MRGIKGRLGYGVIQERARELPPSPFLWGRIREEVKQYTHKQSMHAQTPQCMQAQLGLEPSQAISRWPELRRLRWSNGKGRVAHPRRSNGDLPPPPHQNAATPANKCKRDLRRSSGESNAAVWGGRGHAAPPFGGETQLRKTPHERFPSGERANEVKPRLAAHGSTQEDPAQAALPFA